MLKQKLEVQVAYYLFEEKENFKKENPDINMENLMGMFAFLSKKIESLKELDQYGEIQWETVKRILSWKQGNTVVGADDTELLPYCAEFCEIGLLQPQPYMQEEVYEALQQLNENNSYNKRNEDKQDGGRQDANPNLK